MGYMGNLCIFHSVLLSLIKIAQKQKPIERKWGEKRRERGQGEGSQGEQNEGRKEERQEEKERKTMLHSSSDHVNCVTWTTLSHYICLLGAHMEISENTAFWTWTLVPSSWCTCIHYISLCKTDLLYSLFTSSSFQFCEPQWIPLYLTGFSFAID